MIIKILCLLFSFGLADKALQSQSVEIVTLFKDNVILTIEKKHETNAMFLPNKQYRTCC